jgi:predicted PurR-regulated permease PerM
MLGIDPRTLRVVWTVFLFGLIVATVYFIRETLLLFALAVFFAYMLSPLVQLVQRITPRRRGLALAIVYVILVGAMVGIGISLGSRIAEQATTLVKSLPDMLDPKRLNTIQLPSWLAPLEPLRQRAVEAAQSETSSLQKSIIPILQRATGQILAGLSSAFLIVLVPILSFFLLKDARQISTALIGSFDSDERTLMRQIVADIHLVLSKYIRSLVLLAVAAFAAWAMFLSILGAPYQMLLAGICGALEFIPVAGPLVALVVTVLVCGISGFSGILWIIVFWASFRMFQDYVLNPYLMSSGIEIHPLLVLFGVLAGERIGGIPGMFFSVPVIAILKVIYTRVRQSQVKRTFTGAAVVS